jgi:hypothetical protein
MVGLKVCDLHGGQAPAARRKSARHVMELARQAELGSKITPDKAELLAVEFLGASLADQIGDVADLDRQLIDEHERAETAQRLDPNARPFREVGADVVTGDVSEHTAGGRGEKPHLVRTQVRRGGVHPVRAARDDAQDRAATTAKRLLDYRLSDRQLEAAVGKAAVVVEIARQAAGDARQFPDDTPDVIAQRVIARMIAQAPRGKMK